MTQLVDSCRNLTKTITAKQMKAIAMLAEGQQPVEVALALKVSRRTVERWLDKPDFRSLVEQSKAKAMELLSQEIFEKCRNVLNRGLPKSISRVISALDHPDARIQIRAAEAVCKWSGFYQPQSQAKPESQQPAEENLKDYLAFLAAKNSNGTYSSN